MFELKIALKYLIPKWRQLSVSLISSISILVISLVVWLIVVFLSVTYGLEEKWVKELLALTAPLRVTPTEEYYNSYYYQVDAISAGSDYSPKSIAEKLIRDGGDPYNPEFDEELPSSWPAPEYDEEGNLKDLVKLAYQTINDIGAKAFDYEMTPAMCELYITKRDGRDISGKTLISSKDDCNAFLKKITFTADDPGKEIKGGNGVVLPKSWFDKGARVGDRGAFIYRAPSTSSMQEQSVDIFVEGFYTAGILSIGGNVALADKDLSSLVRASQQLPENELTNGFNVYPGAGEDSSVIKRRLEKEFKKRKIDKYWQVKTFREYDFAKNFLQQLASEKNLFTLVSLIIIIVACSNIITMMVILVNDKKREIGILRSMGAGTTSIAAIFGMAGMVIGFIGSVLGITGALMTLDNLHEIIGWISSLQGFDLFNPVYYGDKMPNEVSGRVLIYVLAATTAVSLIAGLVPAIKACLLKPSEVLRSE